MNKGSQSDGRRGGVGAGANSGYYIHTYSVEKRLSGAEGRPVAADFFFG